MNENLKVKVTFAENGKCSFISRQKLQESYKKVQNSLCLKAAAQNVRLDGDVILQQSEVLHWQAEGAGSMEEVRSVCSCTCNSCNPFQQVNTRYSEDAMEDLRLGRRGMGGAGRRNGGGLICFCTSSSSTLYSGGGACDGGGRGRGGGGSRVDTPTTTLDGGIECCEHRFRRNKADSIHDLRRSTISSVLRYVSKFFS
jgi:hypothetical protein